ncbi:Protein CBR-UGT-58 [Caenorhabditis briggsae]|uniref:glucuronosyltransferase n=1 Tax=Caenorhabditis briggsae TaxID=6238 RepID=A8WP90_CAEBR|nr:Protein CBR-UGT-58 [Caenorhabditis briggsae]CAP22296.2 Protein CBR-UGT-58 [Caenorhabditis briggsae]
MLKCWLLLSIIGWVTAGDVLFIPSTLYPVHGQTMAVLAKELVDRGHQVTWLEIGTKQSDLVLPSEVTREFWPAQFGDSTLQDIYQYRNHSSHSQLWNPEHLNENEQTTGWLASIRLCDSVLTRSRSKFDRLVEKKFSTVIVDDLYNPCGVLIAGLKKSVYIYWSITGLRTESAWANQSPSPPSYLPVAGTGLTDDLTFSERVYNVASYLKQLYLHQHIVQPRVDAVFQKHYPGVSTMFDIERNASINFVNTPPIFDFSRPYMPRVNFVGAIQCRKAKELPKEFATKISEHPEGFVVLSTGFSAQWTKSPESTRQAYLKAFKSFPKLLFIWQFNGKLPEGSKAPSNLITKPWLQLQDLLGHEQCRCHVSHGGLNSVIESVYHGVPVVGVPLTARGYDNLLRITARDSGVMIEKSEFNGDTLTAAIREVTKNEKYKKEMLIFQDMVIDVPYTELYHAAFWVEFIERHQEVPHARSGADHLNFLQYFLVDVIAFFFFVIFCTLSVIFYAIHTVIRTIGSVINGIRGVPRVKVSKGKKTN